MSTSSSLRTLTLVIALLAAASAAHAVPVLQVYLEGATYDSDTQTWVLGGALGGGTTRLWVIGNTASAGTIENVHLAAAYDSTYSPEITLTAAAPGSYMGFSNPTIAATPTTDGSVNTGVPIMDSGKPLPTHDVYGTGMVWEQFNLGDFSLVNTQIADFGGGFPTSFQGLGQINVYDLTISGVGLPDDFTVHFDVYDHIFGSTRSVFAPFSHDAEWTPPTDEEFPPVPEPVSMVMFGCVGAGMFAARKLSRKKA